MQLSLKKHNFIKIKIKKINFFKVHLKNIKLESFTRENLYNSQTTKMVKRNKNLYNGDQGSISKADSASPGRGCVREQKSVKKYKYTILLLRKFI